MFTIFDLLVHYNGHFLFYSVMTPAYWRRNYLYHFNKYWAKYLLESLGTKKISETQTLSPKSLPFCGGWKSLFRLKNIYCTCKKGDGRRFYGWERLYLANGGIRQCLKRATAFKVHLKRISDKSKCMGERETLKVSDKRLVVNTKAYLRHFKWFCLGRYAEIQHRVSNLFCKWWEIHLQVFFS